MTLPAAPNARLATPARTTGFRLAGLAALALAAVPVPAGHAHAADLARPPGAPTFRLAATASPLTTTHAAPAPDAPQAAARPRAPAAPGFRWGCPAGAPQGCW